MYLDNDGLYFAEKKPNNKGFIYFQTSDGNIYLIKKYNRYMDAVRIAKKWNKCRNGVIL